MENPKERDEKWRAHMRIMRSNADALKDQWSQPTKHNSYWQSVPMTNKFKQEVARGGVYFERVHDTVRAIGCEFSSCRNSRVGEIIIGDVLQ